MELTRKYISSLLPKRPKDANKGTFGKVLVIAGSRSYPGAAYLACAAAYRVGAGLVTLATIPLVQNIVSKKLPEVTFLLTSEIDKKMLDYDVILLGPGIGQEKETIRVVEQLTKAELLEMVIDADGLNILSRIDGWWEKLKTNCVLTPHLGEMARLSGLSVDAIQSEKVEVAQRFAKKWRQVVVLKGASTVITSPSGEVRISPFANPALATAGTGDVLAGIIAGFIAQGLDLFDAACCAVFIHGLVAEEISKKIGESGMLASDLLPVIPKVIKNLNSLG